MDVEIFGLLLFVFLAVAMGVTILVGMRLITWLLGTAKNKRGKHEPYECGVPLLGNTRERFSVMFYLIALLFVLFDIETIFLLPYTVSYRSFGVEGFVEVLIFVAVLALGLLYIIKRGALEWD
jgi:NADH-quinone oxidoreductase subunit A